MNPQVSVPPRPSAALALLRLWPRLIAAYLLVAVALHYGWPQLSAFISHAAGTLLLLFNPVPYIREFAWAESTITVSDRIFQLIYAVDDPSLLFTFGFPIGFALALPGLRTRAYWWRVFWTLIASLSVCAVVLAIMADWLFEANFRQFDVEIHGAWHSNVLSVAHANFLTFSMVLYPFLACLVLARVALMTSGSDIVSIHSTARPTRRTRRLPMNLLVLTAMLFVLSGAERHAQALREWPRADVFRTLAERNPELGRSLIRFGDSRAADRKYVQALRWYRRAFAYEGYKAVAAARIRRLRAKVPVEVPR